MQLAYKLVEGDRSSTTSVIIKPAGWTIPEEVANIHGITTETAEKFGIPLRIAMGSFMYHVKQADMLVAHNFSFDLKMMRAALYRLDKEDAAEYLKGIKSYCTQANSRDIVKCPPTERMLKAGRNHYKVPRLEEAYKFFTGEEMVGAHDALCDIEATFTVYKALQALG